MLLSFLCLVVFLTFFNGNLAFINDVTKSLHRETACDTYKMKMRCPASDIISVQEARYGRQDDRTCVVDPPRMSNLHCTLESTMEIVAKKCDGKSECIFTVDQSVFTDPCPGTSKYLQVIWNCVKAVIRCPGKLNSVSKRSTYVTKEKGNGAWMRDPLHNSQKVYFSRWSKFGNSILHEYSSPSWLTSQSPSTFYLPPHRMDGTGFVVYDGYLFYNVESTRTIARYDLSKHKVVGQAELKNANYHGTSPYALDINTDIDLATDEKGLWAIYATEANEGNIVLSRMQHQTLKRLGTWETTYEKLSALNAFVVCGVLYVVGYDSLQIEYMYNTTSQVERRLQIPVPGLNKSTSAMEYNFKERMLYVWDSGIATRYSLHFDSVGVLSGPPTISPPHAMNSPGVINTPSDPNSNNPTQENQGKPVPSFQPPVPTITTAMCLGQTINGLSFPNTTFATSASVDCPGTGTGQAIWTCSGSPHQPIWMSKGPDMTQCLSPWLRNLKNKLTNDDFIPVAAAQDLLTNLYEETGKLTSWDLVEIVNLLEDLVKATSTDIASSSDMADSTLKISSELLRPVQTKIWKGLSRKIQTETATALASVLEEAAFFLAQDMMGSDHSNNLSSRKQNRVMWSQHYATMAIRIEAVSNQSANQNPPSTISPVVTLSSGHGDSVAVNDDSIIDSLAAKPGNKLALVHLSLKNLGGHIVDHDGFGSDPFPVNSRVVTLSTRTWNGGWLPPPVPNQKLSQPVTLHLQHNSNLYTQHSCAFWNTRNESSNGFWWRSGCTRVSGNSSFSVCQCDHLTNFVVLSSNQEFPPMGAQNVNAQHEDRMDLHFNVVRGGIIVSIVFFTITIAALFLFSNTYTAISVLHKHLTMSLLITHGVFLAGISQTHMPLFCSFIAALLHYGVMCAFTWAALLSVHHLMSLRYKNKTYWWYYCIVGYLFPALVVGVTAAADHTAFGSINTCWIRISGGFVWAFIAPCCIAIIISLSLIATVMWKLNRNQTTMTATNAHIRWNTACTCVMMVLLCAEWSSSFLWNSGFHPLLTAWLLSVFSSLCGITAFILFCVLPPEIGLPCDCSCLLKENPEAHQSSSPAHRLNPREESNSSLLHTTPFLNSSVPGPEMTEETRLDSAELLRDRRRDSITMADSTDPKLPASQSNSTALWNDYERSRSGNNQFNTSMGRRVHHRCPRHVQENPGQYYAGTTASYYSGCYDRLHDESGGQHVPQCTNTGCRDNFNQRSQGNRNSHLYETLGPLMTVQFPEVQGYNLSNRHHQYEDVVDPSSVQVHHCMQHPGDGIHCSCHSSHISSASYLARAECPLCRTGRSSDPLSTDQGYDTDSQQPPLAAFLCERGHHGSLQSRRNPHLRSNREMRSSSAHSCASENDREVELINSSTLQRRERCQNSAELPSPSNELDQNETPGPTDAFDTVTSWKGYSGTRLKDAYRPASQEKILKPERTVNLARAQDKSKVKRDGFTLPGTTTAGLKARIDLRKGDISMNVINKV